MDPSQHNYEQQQQWTMNWSKKATKIDNSNIIKVLKAHYLPLKALSD